MFKLNLLLARFGTMVMVSLPMAAAASQGPGTGPGTASHIVQLAMAIVIYGGSALIVGAGLVGGLRHR